MATKIKKCPTPSITEQEQWLAVCGKSRSTSDWMKLMKLDYRERKLFGVACCRSIWDKLIDERSRQAVDVVEDWIMLFGDKPVGADMNSSYEARLEDARRFDARRALVQNAANAAWFAAHQIANRTDEYSAARAAYYCASFGWHMWATARSAARSAAQMHSERLIQGLILETFIASEWEYVKSWSTTTVVEMAKLIYDDKRFDLMPILADALQDAGCNAVRLLDSLRTETAWYRGCKILDNILGKR